MNSPSDATTFNPFLDSNHPLVPGNAVAAIILVSDGRYLLQHRDPIPQIFFPDHWGMFGGAVEPGETDIQALGRELHEELGVNIAESKTRHFTRFDFDFSFCGRGQIRRIFFEVGPIASDAMDRLVLGEGREMRAFTGRDALGTLRMAPYDNFALWMHVNKRRMVMD